MIGRAAPVLLAVGATLGALATPAAAEVLTLEGALAIAEEHNRDVQKAREYQNWIRGRYVEERAQALPRVEIGGALRRDYDETFYEFSGGLFPKDQDTTSYSVSVTQTLFHWGKIAAAIRGANIGVDAGREQLRFYRQAARRAVTEAFYDVILAEEILAIARENLEQRQRHLEEARKKLDLGTATDYDVLAAKVAEENARPGLIRAENAIRTAKKRLLLLLGREEGEIEVAGTPDPGEAELPDYERAKTAALARRPEITQQRLLVSGLEQILTIERAGLRPRMDVSGTYGRSSLAAGDLEVRPVAWSAALTVSFPIFDGFRTQGRVQQARSDVDTARIELSKLEESVTLQVRVALDAAREAEEILSALRGTVRQAERLREMAEEGFEYGVKTRLDVDDAQVNLVQARANLARARRDHRVAVNDLRWVQGVLGEP